MQYLGISPKKGESTDLGDLLMLSTFGFKLEEDQKDLVYNAVTLIAVMFTVLKLFIKSDNLMKSLCETIKL